MASFSIPSAAEFDTPSPDNFSVVADDVITRPSDNATVARNQDYLIVSREDDNLWIMRPQDNPLVQRTNDNLIVEGR